MGAEPWSAAAARAEPPMQREDSPLLVVISGPSGVGKDSVIQRFKELERPYHYVITATTRRLRPGERDGVDYWFLTGADFDALLATGGFIEHATVYGYSYGVPKQQIADALASGKDVLMRVDVQGARTIRRLIPEAVFIFLAPPSLEELRGRLVARLSEDEESLRRRLQQVETEMQEVHAFDYLVVNRDGRLDEAVQTIEAIIVAEHARVIPRQVRLT